MEIYVDSGRRWWPYDDKNYNQNSFLDKINLVDLKKRSTIFLKVFLIVNHLPSRKSGMRPWVDHLPVSADTPVVIESGGVASTEDGEVGMGGS